MANMAVPESIGNYKIIRELGRGSMGTVYLGTQESLGREVAIKVLAPEFTREEEFLERFKREGRTGGSLRHPNIVQVFDLGETADGYYYITMEYMGPLNLKQLLAEQGEKLPQSEAIAFAEQLLSALEHAHSKGIVHRDVKPANILISEQGTAVLTDFSIAQMKSASRLTQTGAAVGTPEYMAPEQFDGKGIDGRADVYAVGIILYQMLSGVQPFAGDTVAAVMKAQLFIDPPSLSSIAPSIAPELSELVRKALHKNRDLRFSSAADMLLALKNYKGGSQNEPEAYLDQFLAAVAGGRISLDDANFAREKVKKAIDAGYRKNLSVMMLQLVGSTKVKMPNSTLHADQAFRDYRLTIDDVLKHHGVMSFDWSVDGAICIFEEILPALRAASEIQGLIQDVGARHPELPERLKARIGVNTGEVYLDPRRGKGEFASRTVDQARQLEKDCPPGAIHVSQVTMEGGRSEFEFEKLGPNRDNVLVFQLRPISGVARVSLKDSQRIPSNVAPTPPRFCPGCAQPVIPGHRHCANCNYEVGSLVGHREPSLSVQVPPPPPKVMPVNKPPSTRPTPSVPAPKQPESRPQGQVPVAQVEPAKVPETRAERPMVGLAPLLDKSPDVDKGAGRLANAPPKEPPARFTFAEALKIARQIIGISAILVFLATAAAIRLHSSLPAWDGALTAVIFAGTVCLPVFTLGSIALFFMELFFVRRLFRIILSLIVGLGLCGCCWILRSLLVGSFSH